MSLDDWKEAGAYFHYSNQAIFYRDEGQGDALICIHGFPTASWDWHRVWPDLVKRFRVIALDMIGFGFSDKPKEYVYSIHDQATLHENLLQTFGVQRIHILAHDYGDTVAQELLARYEEKRQTGAPELEIRSVCFLNGGLFPEAIRPLLIQKLLLSSLGPLLEKLMSERTFRRSFSVIFGKETQPSEGDLRDFWSLITYHEGVKVLHGIIRYMDERKKFRARWVGVMQTTRIPMRFINGADDPISGDNMAARYRELVPDPDVVTLKSIGHYPQIEDPAGVINAFLAFVERRR
jgi:pimeloyl-ACP methyl ester carboxylesterase